MKSPHTKPAKKSETLEVRLSHPDKVALQDKAAREGRTVSHVVRGLISSYLSQAEPRSKTSHLTELLMTLKSKPKSVLATLALLPLFATPFLLPSTALAGDIALTLESEYTEPEESRGADGKRVRRMKTEIEIGKNQVFSIPVAISPSGHPNANLHMSLRASEGDHQIVTIEISICEIIDPSENANKQGEILRIDSCEGQNLIANPHIKAKYGETAEFRMETEVPTPEMINGSPLHEMINGKSPRFTFNNDSRKVFKLTASPRKL